MQVQSEHGNSLKLTCYEEQAGGKALIGEGSTKVVETGVEGTWVPITDDRRVREIEREVERQGRGRCSPFLRPCQARTTAAACCEPTFPHLTTIW